VGTGGGVDVGVDVSMGVGVDVGIYVDVGAGLVVSPDARRAFIAKSLLTSMNVRPALVKGTPERVRSTFFRKK